MSLNDYIESSDDNAVNDDSEHEFDDEQSESQHIQYKHGKDHYI